MTRKFGALFVAVFGALDGLDGLVRDRLIRLRPVRVVWLLRDVNDFVGTDIAGSGDRADDVPVGDGLRLDVRVVGLELGEDRRPPVVGLWCVDVVDHAGLVIPSAGQDGRPRGVGDGGVSDDARRGIGAGVHQLEEILIAVVGQHPAHVCAVNSDHQYVLLRGICRRIRVNGLTLCLRGRRGRRAGQQDPLDLVSHRGQYHH